MRYLKSDSHLKAVKFEICAFIDREILKDQLTYREAALTLRTSPANVSRVVNKKVDQLSFNQLFRYVNELRPNFRILISS